MMRGRRTWMMTFLLMGAVAQLLASERDVRIGVVGYRGPGRVEQGLLPVIRHLNSKVDGCRFRVVEFAESGELVQAAKKGEMEFALVSPGLVIVLGAERDAVPLLTAHFHLRPGTVTEWLGGAVFCRTDHPGIRRLADLRGKTVIGLDPTATGGWLSALREFREEGLDPEEDFSRFRFANSFEAVVDTVLSGEFDAGVLPTGGLERLASAGGIDLTRVRVLPPRIAYPGIAGFPALCSTRLYPQSGFLKLPHTPAKIAEDVTVALLTMPEGSLSPDITGLAGFTTPMSYEPLRAMLRAVEAAPTESSEPAGMKGILRQYRGTVRLAGLALLTLFAGGAAWLFRIHRRLRAAQNALRKDIERKKDLDDLLSYQAQLLFQAGDAIVAVDEEYRITFWNPAAERVFGWKAAVALGKRTEEIFRWAGGQGSRERLRNVVRERGEWSGEISTTNCAGGNVIVEGVVQALRDSTGKVIGSVGSFRDLTEKREAEEAIEALVKGTSSVLGREFFQSVVTQLAGTLRVKYCFVGELMADVPGRVRTVAASADGAIVENFEYDLAGTPCANVVGQSLCLYRSGVREMFPGDALLRQMGVDSYLGVPLVSSTGEPLGLMVALDENPIPDTELPRKLLTIFAARAATELERIRAEEALRLSEQHYSMLFEQMIGAFALHEIICDENGRPCDYRYLQVNPAFERMLGLRARDVIGKRVLELFPRIEKFWIEKYGTVALTGRPARFEDFVAQLNRYFEVRAFCPEQGKFAVIFHDITERKLAEQALRASEERFRVAAEHASDLIYEWDTGTDAVEYHSSTERVLSNIRRPATAAEWKPMIHPEDSPRVMASLERLLRGSGPFDEEYRIQSNTDSWRHILHRAVVFRRLESGALRILGVVTDITERKAAEEERERLQSELLQAQKLESVGRLAGGVAHDFNNLLTVINGYSQLALRKLDPEDPIFTNVDEIHKAGERAAELTRQLLAFSRKQVHQPKVLNVNETIRDIERMLRRIIGENIALECTLDGNVGMVRADPGLLGQVIMNLATNARDAMPSGGRLVIATSNVEVEKTPVSQASDLTPGPYVKVSVTDTGHGMDEQTQRRIFEPFFTTKEQGKGTGLGLSTAYGIVTQSGGAIRVYSEAGVGSTFQVYLPRVSSPATADEPRRPSAAKPGESTILLVEDQPEVRRLTGDALRAHGHTVLEAGSGETGLEICRHHQGPIDLLLTDVVMAGMGGAELARQAALLRPRMKVLFMSGYTDGAVDGPGSAPDAIPFLQKPFTPDALAAKVEESLEQRTAAARILVADDEDAVRTVFHDVLSAAGYDVEETPDGAGVLPAVAARPVDLVISDLVMPRQEGLETIRTLRKQHPEIKIIAVSGAYQGGMLRAARFLGADSVLLKPVAPETLLDAVRRLLGR